MTQRAIASLAVALSIAALALTGCAPTDPRGGDGPAPYRISGNWVLESATDARGGMDLGGSTVTLKIDGDKSGGQGPCNVYGSEISGATMGPRPGIYTGSIKIADGAATDRACATGSLNVLETRYFAVLGKITTASVVDKELVLSGPEVELRFDKVNSLNPRQ